MVRFSSLWVDNIDRLLFNASMNLVKLLFVLCLVPTLLSCSASTSYPEGSCAYKALSSSSGMLKGYACYRDRYVSNDSLETQFLPIRYARVELLNNTNDDLVAQTQSDENGAYEIDIGDLSGNADYRLRILTQGSLSSAESRVLGESGLPYAATSSEVLSGGSSRKRIDIVADSETLSSVFNIFDNFVEAQLYLQAVANVATIPPLDAQWYPGNQRGTYFCPETYNGSECDGSDKMFVLGAADDNDAFDDSVILHEYGHFVMDSFSRDDSPGGQHFLDDTDQDIRLSWSEGFSTAFSSLVKRYHGSANPDEYLDLDAEGNVIYSFSLEVPTGGKNVFSPRTEAYGLANELAVSVVLYDIADSSNADESFDTLEEESLIWPTLFDMKQNSNLSFQDFYELWTGDSLTSVIEDRHIYMLPDEYEFSGAPTDLVAQTPPLNAQFTFHTRDDEDWLKVSLNASQSYTFFATDYLGGAQPLFTIFESDGVTPATNALSGSTVDLYLTSLQFMSDTGGDYLIHIKRSSGSPSYVRYGSYSMEVR